MRGRGKPAFAYSNVTATHYDRLMAYYKGRGVVMIDGQTRGPDGMLLEDFDMNENPMLDGAIAAAGGVWVTRDAPAERRHTDTAAFEAVLDLAARHLLCR